MFGPATTTALAAGDITVARADGDPDKGDRAHRKVSRHEGLRGTRLLSGELTPTADNGRPRCAAHHRHHTRRTHRQAPRQREPAGPFDLELWRARLRDRVRRDPTGGAIPPRPEPPGDHARAGP